METGLAMRFSNNIILEELRPYKVTSYMSEQDNGVYRWVSLLPEDSEQMESDILYVCLLSQALEHLAKTNGFRYLCIPDSRSGNMEKPYTGNLKGLIVVEEERDISWLFTLIQNRLLRLNDWLQDMHAALFNNCDYQQLIDLSEPILNNFIAVLDSSYKLLAYTKNKTSDDPINISLVEKGYHTEETVRLLQEKRRFKFYGEQEDLYTTSAGGISRYDTIEKWCRHEGVPLLHVVLVCSQTPLNTAMIELFEMLMDAITICFQRELKTRSALPVYNSLFMDMLYGGLENPLVIAERAKYANVPFTGNFDVYRIVFEDNAIVLVSRLARELMTYLPNSKVFSHEYEIVVLNAYTTPAIREASANSVSQLRPILEKYQAMCGISTCFHRLTELQNAYIQASRAQMVGSRLGNLGSSLNFDKGLWAQTAPPCESPIFFYDDVFPYFMLHSAKHDPFDLFRNTSCSQALAVLSDYDKEHDTTLVQILYIYLLCERRATAAGNLLHTHRNNVLYHISHIEELLGIDLSDHRTRLKLMLAFWRAEIRDEEIK